MAMFRGVFQMIWYRIVLIQLSESVKYSHFGYFIKLERHLIWGCNLHLLCKSASILNSLWVFSCVSNTSYFRDLKKKT